MSTTLSPNFQFHLQNQTESRSLIYSPHNSELLWADTLQKVDTQRLGRSYQTTFANPNLPSLFSTNKSPELTLVKIQCGFGCNMSCTYCSQKNQRAPRANKRQDEEQCLRFFDQLTKAYKSSTKPIRFEFWGGETLLYWPKVKFLSALIRRDFKDSRMLIFTNGTLITKEIVDYCHDLKIKICISHDGESTPETRLNDPLAKEKNRELIKYALLQLAPLNLISFNATVHFKNFNLKQIRSDIARKLDVSEDLIILSHDIFLPYDKDSLEYAPQNQEEKKNLIQNIYHHLLSLNPLELTIGYQHRSIVDFIESILQGRPLNSLYQKCTMDNPSHIAVDLDGNVLTCQNTQASEGHKIGHLADIQSVNLHTAIHFSQRIECQNCPVVQICKGACMFQTGEIFQHSCEQMFYWNLPILAYVLYLLTGLHLVQIEGKGLRGNPNQNKVNVIDPSTFALGSVTAALNSQSENYSR